MTLSSNPQGVYCPNHDYESASAAYCPWCRAEKAEAERDQLCEQVGLLLDDKHALRAALEHVLPLVHAGHTAVHCWHCQRAREALARLLDT